MADTFVSSRQAAEILGCAIQTVQRYTLEGILKPVVGGTVGKHYMFRRSAIEKFRDKHGVPRRGRPSKTKAQ